MLFTRKGDDGKTKTFGCDQRISKSSLVAEALGALDEANSFLGVVRAETIGKTFKAGSEKFDFPELILEVQQNLFIVQAEVAGATLSIEEEKIKKIEFIVDEIEKTLPPIKNFFISGATKEGAILDVSRTIIRRAERRVVAAMEEGKVEISNNTLAYLNRLSSLVYALARLVNHLNGVEELKPNYK